MVINFLAEHQAATAKQFSQASPFDGHTSYTLSKSKDGLPILDGVLGAISCQVMEIIPLYPSDPPDPEQGPARLSELFLARVLHVEVDSQGEQGPLPLVYHRQKYTTLK